MCLGIPGQITRLILEEDIVRLGEVSFGGVRKEINLSYVPEATTGDWVMVHVGFAIARIDEEVATATIEAWQQPAFPGETST